MRKNVLSMSIAAMIGGLGLVGTANAVVLNGAAVASTTPAGAADAIAAPASTVFQQSNTGFGNALIVPYFSTQSGNNTLLNIVNTDTARGKAVKIRFRGASNSDDIFDFQLYMSPADVWTANISQGADGRSVLTTADKSCTLPASVATTTTGNPFDLSRLPASFTDAQKAAETREGYVEIFVMADIPKGIQRGQANIATNIVTNNYLFDAIKHVAGVAPCTAGTMAILANEPTVLASTSPAGTAAPVAEAPATGSDQGHAASTMGLAQPTGTLFANYTIINVPKTLSFAGEAIALLASDPAAATGINPINRPATANLVFYPQTSTAARAGTTGAIPETSDPLLLRAGPAAAGNLLNAVVTGAAVTIPGATLAVGGPATGAVVTARQFDFPDLSTPMIPGVANAIVQAETLSAALSATAVSNEQLGNTAISAGTDWTFTMPTRRYHVAMNYDWTLATNAAFSSALDGRVFTVRTAANTNAVQFTTANTTVNTAAGKTHQICTTADAIRSYDREETTSSGGFVISPGISATVRFCGEASVLSFNAGGADTPSVLGASIARQDVTTAFLDGWTTVGVSGLQGTAGANPRLGLPVVGRSYIKAQNGTTFFGIGANHRYVRP